MLNGTPLGQYAHALGHEGKKIYIIGNNIVRTIYFTLK